MGAFLLNHRCSRGLRVAGRSLVWLAARVSFPRELWEPLGRPTVTARLAWAACSGELVQSRPLVARPALGRRASLVPRCWPGRTTPRNAMPAPCLGHFGPKDPLTVSVFR